MRNASAHYQSWASRCVAHDQKDEGGKWVWNKSPGWSTWTGPLIRAARVKQHVSSTPHPSLPFPNTRFFNVPACFSSLCAQRRHPGESRPNEPHAGQCRGAERAGTPALEKTLQTLKVCWLRCNSLVPKNTCVRHGKETRLFPFGSWQTSIWKIRFIVKYFRILFVQRIKKEDCVGNKFGQSEKMEKDQKQSDLITVRMRNALCTAAKNDKCQLNNYWYL